MAKVLNMNLEYIKNILVYILIIMIIIIRIWLCSIGRCPEYI